MKIGIGIDTGGTYTDAVVYDFETQKILGSAKSPTTRENLVVGILGAIDGLPAEYLSVAEVISLSTTLATNACVEDRGGRAKLIFFGGDRTVIERNGPACGLPPADEICLIESRTRFSGVSEQEPDWDAFRERIRTGFSDLDGVGIVEQNASRTGAAAEKKAKALFRELYDIPVVCGHELFSELNVLKRGASTLLNAGLFPVIGDFLAAVKTALAARDMHPQTLVIVRSDGSLMNEDFAALHPVETLICGPAASAIGCARLTDAPNSIVVDMGGTTTDIAFIENGLPVTVTSGVSIGKWKTFVNGLYVKTFGLGGDSAVHYQGKNLLLEPYRVLPLCAAAARYPVVTKNLRKLEKKSHTRYLYEHLLLVRDIADSPLYTDEEKALCRALAEGPRLLQDAAAAIGKDIYTLRADRLIRDGVVQLCGFTPTDAMHLTGDFTAFDTEAARLAAEFIAWNLDISVKDLCDRVYDAVRKKMYIHLVEAMLENKYPEYRKNGVNRDVERFIAESYEEAKSGKTSLFSAAFRTDYVLCGAGAPIRVFLPDVAALLGTRAVIPEDYHMANALGAVVGSVHAACTIEISAADDEDGSEGFRVFGRAGGTFFRRLEDAVQFAKAEAMARAEADARERGAAGEITVTAEACTNRTEARGMPVYLGTVVTAQAAGTLGFRK